jgi:hypothetical protein
MNCFQRLGNLLVTLQHDFIAIGHVSKLHKLTITVEASHSPGSFRHWRKIFDFDFFVAWVVSPALWVLRKFNSASRSSKGGGSQENRQRGGLEISPSKEFTKILNLGQIILLEMPEYMVCIMRRRFNGCSNVMKRRLCLHPPVFVRHGQTEPGCFIFTLIREGRFVPYSEA